MSDSMFDIIVHQKRYQVSAELANCVYGVDAPKRGSDEWKAARAAYRAENMRLLALFRSDLETEFDVVGHKHANTLWDLAWERGHSTGLYDVYLEYEQLVVLLK